MAEEANKGIKRPHEKKSMEEKEPLAKVRRVEGEGDAFDLRAAKDEAVIQEKKESKDETDEKNREGFSESESEECNPLILALPILLFPTLQTTIFCKFP